MRFLKSLLKIAGNVGVDVLIMKVRMAIALFSAEVLSQVPNAKLVIFPANPPEVNYLRNLRTKKIPANAPRVLKIKEDIERKSAPQRRGIKEKINDPIKAPI